MNLKQSLNRWVRMNKLITWFYKFKPNRFADFGDVTFVHHERGRLGSVIFCNIKRGGIHLNATPNRAQRNMGWFVNHIDRHLTHETIHLIICRLVGVDASRALDMVDIYGDNRFRDSQQRGERR